MKTYWNITDRLKVIPEWQPNCWIQVTCPTNEDQYELEKRFNIPDYFFPDISDTDVPVTNMMTAGCSSFYVFPT